MPTKAAPMTEENSATKGPYTYACGKRKTAVARVRLFAGTGKIVVNGRELKKYFPVEHHVESVLAPFVVAEVSKKTSDIEIVVSGGGPSSQAEACRHGIAQALQIADPVKRVPLKQAGFLRRDARVKERKKPGLKRARRAPQWAKR